MKNYTELKDMHKFGTIPIWHTWRDQIIWEANQMGNNAIAIAELEFKLLKVTQKLKDLENGQNRLRINFM